MNRPSSLVLPGLFIEKNGLSYPRPLRRLAVVGFRNR